MRHHQIYVELRLPRSQVVEEIITDSRDLLLRYGQYVGTPWVAHGCTRQKGNAFPQSVIGLFTAQVYKNNINCKLR